MAKRKDESADPITFTPAPELETAEAPAAERRGPAVKKSAAAEKEPARPEGTLAADSSGRLTVTLADGTVRAVEPDEYDDLGGSKVRLRRA